MRVGRKRDAREIDQETSDGSIDEAVNGRLKGLDWCLGQVKRRKYTVTVLGVIVGALIILALKKEDDPFSNFPKSAQNAPSTQAASSSATPPPDASPKVPSLETAAVGVGSAATLFDPNDPNTEPQYRLPARLSTEQVHQLCIDLDVLDHLLDKYAALIEEFRAIQDKVSQENVRQELFKRVSTGVGFKYPELSLRWSEFVNVAEQIPWDLAVHAYSKGRVARIQSHVLDASFSQGDLKFVEYSTVHTGNHVVDLLPKVNHARHLEQWLLSDAIVPKEMLVDGYQVELPKGTEVLGNLRADAEVRLTPPHPLTTGEQAELIAWVDSVRDRPQPKKDTSGDFFKSEHTNGMLRVGSGGGIPEGKYCPNFSALEILEYTRKCYLYRRQAFRDLLPLVFAARTARTLNNKDLEAKLHAVTDRMSWGFQTPEGLDLGAPFNFYDETEESDLRENVLIRVRHFLKDLKERVIAGKSDSRDLR